MATRQLPRRQDLDPAFTWRLEDLFATDEAWEAEFASAKAAVTDISAYSGRLGESATTLLEALDARFALALSVERLYAYAHMRRDEDNAHTACQALADRATALMVETESATAYFTPEILALPPEKLMDGLSRCEGLAVYSQYLDEIVRQRDHVLSAPEEKLLAMAGEVAEGPGAIFTMLNNADMWFPTVRDENGDDVELTHGRYIPLMESRDRGVRRAAFEALYGVYGKYSNTLCASLSSSVKKDIFFARARKYPSALASALDPDNVPQAVYDSLIAAVRSALPDMHRLVRLKKRALGLSQMHMYDLYVPLAEETGMRIPYREACGIVCEGLAPLGGAYVDRLRQGVEREGWIDVYENQGKTSGAYSWGVWGGHPYVLLNWNDTLDNVFTLAHELGHSMHSFLSNGAQPYAKSAYPLLLAEVASTCNEAILMDFMLRGTAGRSARMYLLGYFLEQFRTTMFRQVMFAEFEKITHAMAESGEALTPAGLREVYHRLNTDYYGPDMIVDEAVDIEWARIPHFYRPFYVYKYATGFASAVYLSRTVLEGGAAERERYLNFLSGGGSDYPLNLLRRAGVDLTRPDTVADALKTFGEIITEMEDLTS